ncbi:VWA domain-containing protein [Balamuthia mandrillaris]
MLLDRLLAAVVPSGDEARDTTVDWTESVAPFFLVMTNDGKGEQGSTFTPATDSLPLLSTNESIQVAGVIADVTVRCSLSHGVSQEKIFSLFAFGIGSSVNRHFIEGIAKAGLGEPLIITSNDEVQDKLNKFRRYIAQPVLTNVQLNFEDIDVYDVEPRSIPSLLAQRPIIVSGKYRGAVNSTSSVMVTGFTGSKSGSPSKWSSEVMSFASSQSVGDSSVLRYLWARRRLDLLDINLSEYQPMKDGLAYDEICAIGLQHHLLTRCTSFVAVDHLLRNQHSCS